MSGDTVLAVLGAVMKVAPCIHASALVVDNKGIVSYQGTAGEPVYAAPKEQPPRKLSGQRTAKRHNSGKWCFALGRPPKV